MADPIERKVIEWEKTDGSKYREINHRIIHLEQRLFHDYEPTLGPLTKFLTRLSSWLDNTASEEEQKLLFELVPNLFYVGREEFNVLYREAYINNCYSWIIDQLALQLVDPDLQSKIETEIMNTWFCPITDSLRINFFYHVNNIPGKHDYRPDWRSLVKFGNPNEIKKYIKEQDIRRIVLLEDFIGNGGQVSKAVMFAAQQLDNIPVLVIPLIICPEGMENSKRLENEFSNVKIMPVVSLPQDCFVAEEENLNNSEFLKKLNRLCVSSYQAVSNSATVDDNVDPYGPFGWRKTGGLVVMYTNTPNNTLPLIHNASKSWHPLFNRHKRV